MLGYALIRNQFLDNLYELEAFLQFRISELVSDSKGKGISLAPLQVKDKSKGSVGPNNIVRLYIIIILL